MNDSVNFLQFLFELGERPIAGRVVNRVAAQNQQQIHFAFVNVGCEIVQRFRVIDRIHFNRFGVINRRAHISKRSVDRVR